MNEYFAVITLILVMLFCLRSVLRCHSGCSVHMHKYACTLRILRVLFGETDAWDFIFCVCVGICESYFSTIYLKITTIV